MENLCGFSHQCGGPARAPAPAPVMQAPPSLEAQVASSTGNSGFFGAISGALYRIAAAAGKNVICPYLPEIGAAVAGGLVTEGYVTIVEAPLAATVGAAIGAHLQSQLCGYYSAAGQAAASRVR